MIAKLIKAEPFSGPEEREDLRLAARRGDMVAALDLAGRIINFYMDDLDELIIDAEILGAPKFLPSRPIQSYRAGILARLGRLKEAEEISEEVYKNFGDLATDHRIFWQYENSPLNNGEGPHVRFIDRAASRGHVLAKKTRLLFKFRSRPLLRWVILRPFGVVFAVWILILLARDANDPRLGI